MAATSYYMPREIQSFLTAHGDSHASAQEAIRVATADLEKRDYQISVELGGLLKVLVAATRPTTCVEVGTFTGYSAACIASALPVGGELRTFEKSDEYADMAAALLRQAKLSDRVTIVRGDATINLPEFVACLTESSRTIDFAFVDADKQNFPAYFDAIQQALSPAGVIVVDNIFRHGAILEETPDAGTAAIQVMLGDVMTREDLIASVIPVGDGVLLVTRVPSRARNA